MKRNRMLMTLLLAGLIGAAQPVLAQAHQEATRRSTIAVADPAVQLRDMAQMLRSNNLVGLVTALMPPTQFQQLRTAYEIERGRPTTDADRAKFAEGFAKFAAPGAVDTLMGEIEPKLAEARPKAPGALMMGLGALQVAIASKDSDLTEDQRASLQAAFPGIQRWASSTDFLSSESMRQALTLITDAARNTRIGSLDELKMLSLEEVLAQAGQVFAASKRALNLYGLDLDAIAGSMQVQVLAIEGQTARIRTTVTLFDAPIASEHELVLVDGRWYGKHALDAWTIHSEEHSEG